MKKEAVKQAWEALHKAERAHDKMMKPASLDDIEEAWGDFLFAVSVVYNKLHAGSKGDGKSVGWYGRVVNLRRTDPLLSYLHHARDVATHGIMRIAEKREGFFAITGDFVLNGSFGPGQTMHVTGLPGGRPPGFHSQRAHLELVKVVDERFGTEFDVPATHLDQPIASKTPQEFSRLTVIYLRDLLKRAGELV